MAFVLLLFSYYTCDFSAISNLLFIATYLLDNSGSEISVAKLQNLSWDIFEAEIYLSALLMVKMINLRLFVGEGLQASVPSKCFFF